MRYVRMVTGLTPITFPKPPLGIPQLQQLAEDMRIRLIRHTGGIKGWYDHPTRTISTRRGMAVQQYRSTLAHELGHAWHGDIPTGCGHYDQRQEDRAWRFAARLLICPDEFRAAAIWHNHHMPAIADELEITQHLLDHYTQTLERKTA